MRKLQINNGNTFIKIKKKISIKLHIIIKKKEKRKNTDGNKNN